MRVLLTLAALGAGQSAWGYSAAPPQSFAKPTADGKHVLVMLQPRGQQHAGPVDKKYPASGLYPIGDDKTPRWTCDWSADWSRSVLAANDGIHAVRVPDVETGLRRWLLGDGKGGKHIPAKPGNLATKPAMYLYKDGKPLTTLTLDETFDCAALTDVDCFLGPVVEIDHLDDASNRVYLTIQGERRRQSAVIDIRTGQVVSRGEERALDKCGNDGEPSGIFGFGADSVDGRQRLGIALLALLVAAVTVGAAFALVVIWRRRGPNAD